MLADVEAEESSDGPKAHAYFEFHAEEVDLTFTVEKVGKTSITFALRAKHDDIDYYDDRARRTPTVGLFELKRRKPGEIWVPV